MKKKNIVLCFVFCLALMLAGCGSSSSSGPETAGYNMTDTAASTAADSYDGGVDAYGTEEYATEEYDPENGAGTGSDVGEIASGSVGDENSSDTQSSENSYAQKLIRTINMTVETTEFDKLITNLKERTQELGGYVENSELYTSVSEYSSRWAYLTLRIPSDSLDTFLTQVNEEANVTYTNESTEDVTLSYTDLASHVTALRTEQETLLSMLEQAESMEDILAIQSQLTQVRYEIESYESQLRIYDNKVNYSTVYMDIKEVVRETSAAGTTFGDSVKKRFTDNLYVIGRGFRNFAIGFLGSVPILVILAVLVTIVAIIYRKIRKRKMGGTGRKSGRAGGEKSES